MLKTKRVKILEKAIAKYGAQMQSLMLVEEVGELIQAVIKMQRNPMHATLENLAEEIADVEICIEQQKMIYKDANLRQMVDAYKKQKIQRLDERMKDSEK